MSFKDEKENKGKTERKTSLQVQEVVVDEIVKLTIYLKCVICVKGGIKAAGRKLARVSHCLVI